MATLTNPGLPPAGAFLKRAFDVSFSLLGLVVFGWLILLGWLASAIDTRKNGFFLQTRIGLRGRPFKVIKLRTMRDLPGVSTSVTTSQDPRITMVGKILRKSKIDELPQLINVLLGTMSFVGPRPDVPGFADQLDADDRVILEVRPGITGPATLKYRVEEQILANQKDPEKYNREIIYPDKVSINKEYIRNYNFLKDLYYIFKTLT